MVWDGLRPWPVGFCSPGAISPVGTSAALAAAGAAAGIGSEVPRVFDRAVVAVFVGGAHGELVHIGFTQANGARSAEFLYHGGVVRREKVIEHFGAAAGFDALRTKNIF